MINISARDVLTLLENGYTRTSKDKNYNPDIGCIQDHYQLSNKGMKTLFSNDVLKGRRTKGADNFNFVDDVNNPDLAVKPTDEAGDEPGKIEESLIMEEAPLVEEISEVVEEPVAETPSLEEEPIDMTEPVGGIQEEEVAPVAESSDDLEWE